jgi:hypothetical protein
MIPSDRRPKPEDFVFYDGVTLRVEWHYASDGRMPARECFFSLPLLDQERLEKMVEFFADAPIGTRLARSAYRIEDPVNKIYAFKPRDERYFSFITDERRIIITNAYRKHSQKMDKTDLEKLKIAVARRRDYLHRIAAGTYYEHET